MDASTAHITMLSNSSSYDAHTLSDNVINDSAGIGVTDTANDHLHSDDTSEDDWLKETSAYSHCRDTSNSPSSNGDKSNRWLG